MGQEGIDGQGVLVQGRERATLQGAPSPQPWRVLLSSSPSFVPPTPPAPIVTGQPFRIWRWGLVSLLDFLPFLMIISTFHAIQRGHAFKYPLTIYSITLSNNMYWGPLCARHCAGPWVSVVYIAHYMLSRGANVLQREADQGNFKTTSKNEVMIIMITF